MSIHAKFVGLFAMVLFALAPSIALAQARLERGGVVLYWGLEFAISAWSPHHEVR